MHDEPLTARRPVTPWTPVAVLLRRSLHGFAGHLAAPRSRGRDAWMVGAGIVLPTLLFAISRTLFGFPGLVPKPYHVQPFVAIEVLALAVWLAGGRRIHAAAGAFAGVFLAGSLFALALGAALLPFAVIGIRADGIGLLGFGPLLTGVVFLRATVQACRAVPRTWPPVATVLVVALVAPVPAVAAYGVGKASLIAEKVLTCRLLRDPEKPSPVVVDGLKALRAVQGVPLRQLEVAWLDAEDGPRKERLAALLDDLDPGWGDSD